jgi:3-hydroxyisobutyrate dehydrogenase-like beta-hydroxyacid dehydrogenase
MTGGLHRLGFVGFGAMPRRMAVRLRDASHAVIAFDIAHPAGELDGFRLSKSPHSLAQEVNAVLVCIPDDHALQASMHSENGALEGTRPGQLIVNFSTVSPDASRALAEAATRRQVKYVEAPTSGSTPEAETGELVILAGGSKDDVEAAAPILDVVGHKTIHTGSIGDGLVTKLIVNGVMALGTAALAEGLAYGVHSGVDRDVLIEVLSSLILVSEHHKRKLAMAKASEYPPTFTTKLMSKDMGLLLADARTCGAPMPSMAAASQLYAYARQLHPNEDYASAIGAMESLVRSMSAQTEKK